MVTIRLGGISLDCADPGPLATFWADLLGGTIAFTSPEIVIVKLDHLLLTAMRVEDYLAPTWPTATIAKQSHLDIDVDDLDEAARRAVALGAVRAPWQPDPDGHLVFLDPAGHPFCLTTEIDDDLRARP
jgi:catechol 2,3-dioxygenase-like lactoylglutathione lyase family enzyme